MEDETENVFKEQLSKLPKEVIAFLSSANWSGDTDEIGSLYNLSGEELVAFKREVTLVLAGLVHPDEFREVLEQEVGIAGAVLDEIVKSVETKIFAPIRPALIEFLKKEGAMEQAEVPPVLPVQDVPIVPPISLDVPPDNLPVAEEVAPLMPPIPSKAPNLEVEPPSEGGVEPAHPFEEKMKKVFTAGQQSMGDLTIEPTTSSSIVPAVPDVPPPPRIYHADPYREPIE